MGARNAGSRTAKKLAQNNPTTHAAKLLTWFDLAQRDLPWRRSNDPWAIWVSEIMLQQTRVEAVREPYARFLERYSTPASFAEASDDDVMIAWRGLGYYRRARLLREGARRVAEFHGGKVPADLKQLQELPGIGPYTLGAVASIAFGHPEPAVDGNVERVISRHRGFHEPIGTSKARRAIRHVVVGWIDADRPGDFNQSLMELGAVVCTPTSPNCSKCPIHEDCVAREENQTELLPVKKAPRAAIEVSARAVLVLRARDDKKEALGYRIPQDQPNAGQVELPGPGVLVDCDPADLQESILQRFGAALNVGEVIASVRHAITHHRISLLAHEGTVRTAGSLEWIPLDHDSPWTTPSRKVFRQSRMLEA